MQIDEGLNFLHSMLLILLPIFDAVMIFLIEGVWWHYEVSGGGNVASADQKQVYQLSSTFWD